MAVEEESKRTSPLPGLALGCEPAEVEFRTWEKRERRGVLKPMFNWKVKPRQNHLKPKPVINNKKEKSDKDVTTKSEKVDRTCRESVDKTIFKIMSRGRRRGLKKAKQREIHEKDRLWRGPREQPSEIPVQRQINKKEPQVPLEVIKLDQGHPCMLDPTKVNLQP